jgi:hypothetical protein
MPSSKVVKERIEELTAELPEGPDPNIFLAKTA